MSTIENGAVTAVEEQSVDAGGQQEMENSAVSLSEFLSEAQDSNAESPDAGVGSDGGETVVNDNGDDGRADESEESATADHNPQTVYRTQAEFDAAFSKRMANERARNRPFVEIGREVVNVAGDELSADEVRAAISHALAEKRSKNNSTDYDTEMNNIRVEQRIARRYSPQRETSAPQQAEADEPRRRAGEMISAMESIGDERFTVEALQRNNAAMEAWANGATPSQVYRQFFLSQPSGQSAKKASARPAPERSANAGATGSPARKFSFADIDKIDKALESGKRFIP